MKNLFVLLLICFFSVVSAKSPFDQHKNTISSIKRIHVITDNTIVELVGKNKYGLNQSFNTTLGVNLFKVIKKVFSKKLNVEFSHALNSIGLKNDANVYFSDYLDLENKLFVPIIDNKTGVDGKATLMAEFNSIADQSYDSSNPSFGMHKKYQLKMKGLDFSNSKNLNLPSDEAVLLLLTTGVKVPTKTSVKGAIASTVLTLGMFTISKVSVTNMNVLLISNDGTLLWAGKVLRKGPLGNEWKQGVLFKKTLKGFPKL